MEALKLLESVRNPLLDELFALITYFGDEILILAVAFVVLWCLNKRMGYFIIYSLLIGVTVNLFLKGFFQVPRPWARDASFTIVEKARAAATGYSFPSAHTQNATILFGSIARSTKSLLGRILFIVLIFIIGFSRMYLGVHTPADVITSWVVGTALIFAIYPLMNKAEESPLVGVIMNTVFVIAAILLVIVAESTAPGQGELASFATEGVENAYTLLGVIAAFPIIWYLDFYKMKYEIKAVWWAQILKCFFGLVVLFAIRIALKPLMLSLFGDQGIGTALRYFFIALFGGAVWPLTFRFWAKLK